MKHNWTKSILSVAIAATLFTSCKPKPDTDTPFPQKVSPSVFMASNNQFVYAIDPTSGLKKWECFINSDIIASPYLYGGTIFVGNNSATLFKLDPNTGAKSQSLIGFPSGILMNPIGFDNFLYVASGTDITCIDIKPDTFEWKYSAGGAITTSPTIKDTQVVFGCSDGFVYTIDRRNGNLIWKSANYGTVFSASPTMDANNVYIGADNGTMYSLKRTDGSQTWAYSTSFPIKSSPLVFGGNVFFGNDESKLFSIDIISGTPRWTFTAGARILSSPFLQGQTIYVGSYDKTFYAINVLDGKQKWSFKTDGLINSSPVCYGANVYFGSYDLNLYAVDTTLGKLTWKYAINGVMDCSPSIDENNAAGNGINSTISGASVY